MVGLGVGLGGQGGCERRIEVFVQFKKKFGGVGVRGSGLGGQGGCEGRIEVLVKIQKKKLGVGVLGRGGGGGLGRGVGGEGSGWM